MRRVGIAFAGLALAVLALGIAVLPLQSPVFTRVLSARTSLAREAGLSSTRMSQVAEQVRAFVIAGVGELPAQVDGRPGFDEAAVSHLVDVRGVLFGARTATGLLAGALTVWMGVAVFTRRTAAIAAALRVGAALAVGLVVVAGVFAATSFDAFFSAFHGLFFASGTWTFPADSLLIETFPEPFWTWAAVGWAVCVMAVAGVYVGLGGWLGRSARIATQSETDRRTGV